MWLADSAGENRGAAGGKRGDGKRDAAATHGRDAGDEEDDEGVLRNHRASAGIDRGTQRETCGS